MKKLTHVLFIIITIYSILFSQSINGDWYGAIDVSGQQLRLVLHINSSAMGYSGTMDSPDQNAFEIPATSVTFSDGKLNFKVKNIGMVYEGELHEDGSLKGTFNQRGMKLPLNMNRKEIEKQVLNRPQTPKEPFPYNVEEVTFRNEIEGFDLAGTLTIPEKGDKFPAVILISGSGAQNRDEEIFQHKPFMVIADHLTKNGIAVLRYDDRGTAKSSGDHSIATSKLLANDVKAAVAFLKSREDINNSKIGLIGHSEGGIIAPMVVASDKTIDFIILLAGPGVPGKDLILSQIKAINIASGMDEKTIERNLNVSEKAFDMVLNSTDEDALRAELLDFFTQSVNDLPEMKNMNEQEIENFINSQIESLVSPWIKYFLAYDPAVDLQNVKCPVFAINGSKDHQVPAKENLDAIKRNLNSGGDDNITIKEYQDLNHLFQNCDTGLPNEYIEIEETFSKDVLADIANWIKKQVEKEE